MKTALILTGHMRCWKDVYQNTKLRIIDKYNPDIFIHTWDDEGYWVSPDNEANNDGINKYSPKIIMQELVDAYNPESIVIQNFDNEVKPWLEPIANKYLPYCDQIRPLNICSQFYKIFKGINLLEDHILQTGEKYDFIIRMRPDLVFFHDLPDLSPTRFYTVQHRNHTGQGTGDMFYAGPFMYMNMIKYIPFFYDYLIKELNRFCPHMFIEFLARKNIGALWNELDIPKKLQHSPKGEYQNYKPEN